MLNTDSICLLASSFDVPGFLTRTLDHTGAVMAALDVSENPSPDPSFVVPCDMLERCDPEIVANFLRALNRNSMAFTKVASMSTIPLSDLADGFRTLLQKEASEANKDVFVKASARTHTDGTGISAIFAKMLLADFVQTNGFGSALFRLI
ncbi:hypothetical protein RvVAR0630_pl01380 (plasmid) [Agrobacterium vitis]|nr:hypothetical protein RvVAR0630_pl01380 [Agrobacterium vitis]